MFNHMKNGPCPLRTRMDMDWRGAGPFRDLSDGRGRTLYPGVVSYKYILIYRLASHGKQQATNEAGI